MGADWLALLCALAAFCLPMALAWWLLARSARPARHRSRDALPSSQHD